MIVLQNFKVQSKSASLKILSSYLLDQLNWASGSKY